MTFVIALAVSYNINTSINSTSLYVMRLLCAAALPMLPSLFFLVQPLLLHRRVHGQLCPRVADIVALSESESDKLFYDARILHFLPQNKSSASL